MKNWLTLTFLTVLLLISSCYQAQEMLHTLSVKAGYSLQLPGNNGRLNDYANSAYVSGVQQGTEIASPSFGTGLVLAIGYDLFKGTIGFGLDLGYLRGTAFELEDQTISGGDGLIRYEFREIRFFRASPFFALKYTITRDQNFILMGVGPLVNTGGFEELRFIFSTPFNAYIESAYKSNVNFGLHSFISYRRKVVDNWNLELGIKFEELRYVPKRKVITYFTRDGKEVELSKRGEITEYVDSVSDGDNKSQDEPAKVAKISFPLSNINFFVKFGYTF